MLGNLNKKFIFIFIFIVTAYDVLRICHLTNEIRTMGVNSAHMTRSEMRYGYVRKSAAEVRVNGACSH